jgi:hypothetical protein
LIVFNSLAQLPASDSTRVAQGEAEPGMTKLSFDQAVQEISKLYVAAEPFYARHLSKELLDLVHRTHELAFIFKGFPPDMASSMAAEKACELAAAQCDAERVSYIRR